MPQWEDIEYLILEARLLIASQQYEKIIVICSRKIFIGCGTS